MASPETETASPAKSGNTSPSRSVTRDVKKKSKVTGWLVYRRMMYDFFERPETPVAQWTNFSILMVIIFSIICLIVETTEWGKSLNKNLWFLLEAFSTGVFSVEYFCRLIACTEAIPRLKFVLAPSNIIDIAAILPFYVEVTLMLANREGGDMITFLRVFRAVRLARLFRLFKSASAYSSGINVMSKALRLSLQALWVLVFWCTIGVVIFSSCVYYAERMSCPTFTEDGELHPMYEADHQMYVEDCWAGVQQKGYDAPIGQMGWSARQPGLLCCTQFGAPMQFQSILRTFWWTIVTMTCVGYGDDVPHTMAGRAIAVFCMIFGILLISLPTAIVGAKFQQVYQEVENEKKATEDGRRVKLTELKTEHEWNAIDWSVRPELIDAGTVLESCLDQDASLSRRLRTLRTEQHTYTQRLLSEIRGLELFCCMLHTETPEGAAS
jgi:hypothetical protein